PGGRARLQGDGSVGGGADTGVDEHGHAGLVEDETQVPGVDDAHARTNERGQRHDRHAAQVFEHAALNGVVGAIHHDLEAVGHQRAGGLERGRHVGEEVVFVAQNLELDQVTAVEQFAGQS